MSSKIQTQKALLVEAILDRKQGDHLSELSELAYVSGYHVAGKITQNIQKSNPDYLFGKGKAKEIKGKVKELGIDVVIIENKLEVNQLENLRKMWRVEIIDRFELILEIFIKRANTLEAITQIRLAALKKVGGSRLEDHRSVETRHKTIKKLEKKLDHIRKAKDLRRKRRISSGFDLIAICGYTNAGKSTLMNALTKADVEVDGRMFTTLSTTTRSFDSFGRKILVTDTVGFISRLPHVLMAAFYATLKEIKDADLILFLIDCYDSKENITRKVLASMNTLTAIQAEGIPLIPVLNKIDIAENVEEKAAIVEAALKIKPVLVSAKDQIHLIDVKEQIMNVLETFRFHIKIPNNNDGMSLVSKIHNKTRITNEVYHHDCVEMHFETNARLGSYLFNLLQKSKLVIEIMNKEELEKQVKMKEEEPKEDTITVLKTDEGEEIFIFDMVEESGKKSDMNDTPKKFGSITSLKKKD